MDMKRLRDLEGELEVAKSRVLFWKAQGDDEFSKGRLELWIDLVAEIEKKINEVVGK